MTDDLRRQPAATILATIVGAVILGLGSTAWTDRNQQAGFVSATILFVSGMPFARLVAREFAAFAPYVNLARLGWTVAFVAYLMFFDATWVLLGSVILYATIPMSLGFAALAFVAGFITGAVLLNKSVRNALGRFARPAVGNVFRAIARWSHRFATNVDRPTEPEQLVALLNSTERVSQVGPRSLHSS